MTPNHADIWKALLGMAHQFVARLPYLCVGLIVFLLFYLAARWLRFGIRRLASRRKRHHNLGLALGRLMQSVLLLVGALVALVIMLPGFKPVQLVQFLGLGTVAIGFAFRDILQNFLAGILILVTEPFHIGDQIVCGEFEGEVEDIQTRATIIRTYDGRRIVIPNTNLFTEPITVNTAFEIRRIEYDVGIGFGDDAEQAKKLIVETLRNVPGVLEEPAPEALVVDLGASAVKVRARWWIKPPRRLEIVTSRDQVLTEIKKQLSAHGIDLPFETRTVLFHDQTDANDGDRTRQREGWPAGDQNPAPCSLPRSVRELTRALVEKPERENGAKPRRDSTEIEPHAE